jgi:hypothetical protein
MRHERGGSRRDEGSWRENGVTILDKDKRVAKYQKFETSKSLQQDFAAQKHKCSVNLENPMLANDEGFQLQPWFSGMHLDMDLSSAG